jgi:hypothetical protein
MSAADPNTGATQDEPIMDQHVATDEDKIEGIVAQTRIDVGDKPLERIADVLRQRFHDAGLDVDDDRTAELAERVSVR